MAKITHAKIPRINTIQNLLTDWTGSSVKDDSVLSSMKGSAPVSSSPARMNWITTRRHSIETFDECVSQIEYRHEDRDQELGGRRQANWNVWVKHSPLMFDSIEDRESSRREAIDARRCSLLPHPRRFENKLANACFYSLCTFRYGQDLGCRQIDR